MYTYVCVCLTPAGCLARQWRVSLAVPVASIALFTLGELCVSPVGLALVSSVSRGSSSALGLWFFSGGVGGVPPIHILYTHREDVSSPPPLLLASGSFLGGLAVCLLYIYCIHIV